MARVAKILGWLILAPLAFLVAGAALLPFGGAVAAAGESMGGVWIAFLAARLAAIAALWLYWEPLVERVLGSRPAPREVIDYWRSRRHAAAALLLAVEAILAQNLFGALWRIVG